VNITTKKEELRFCAALIRKNYLNKPVGKANVALAEVYLENGVAFCVGATSRGGRKSPIPDRPLPKSLGGRFAPTLDSRTQRLMDTDSEYKVLSEIADRLEMSYDLEITGHLYLYTELQPCESCNGVISQFRKRFPNFRLDIFWDYPYLP
jgi:hypothetical protein